MAASVRDFASDYPDVNHASLVERFGTPQQIVTAYVEDMEVPELVDKLRFSGKIVRITAIAAIAVVLLWLGVVSVSLIYNLEQSNGTIETYIEVVENMPEQVD